MTETSALRALVALLAVLVVVGVVARRLRVAPSILTVVAGGGLALVPGVPRFELVPELVLLIVLPPIIYDAGVNMSWREFRANIRSIGLLAVGCVVFTMCTVAAVAHFFLGLDWALAFVLGAIVAPPDTLAPIAIARHLGIPRDVLVILEGEGLANDGTALVLYRFAVAAVAAGAFSVGEVLATFSLIVTCEPLWGIAVGWAGLRLRRWLADPHLEIVISMLMPYAAFWVPEELGGSGVIATITAGLYVSWNGPILISAATRVQGIFFWDLGMYVIEGLVLLYTGLQVRTIVDGLETADVAQLLSATLIVTAILVLSRFAYVFPTAYVSVWVERAMGHAIAWPPWRGVLLVAFVGVRGIVSLSAALALPFTTHAGAEFPGRELILVVTFGVIIITLVGQGLLVPALTVRLGLADRAKQEREVEQEQELAARQSALDAARRKLETIAGERHIEADALEFVRGRHDQRARLIPSDLGEGLNVKRLGAALRIEAIEEERRAIRELLREGKLTDDARRRLERELDLEEQVLSARRGH
ncbi:Na+/H+ antiporter [Sandaracinus amylolyticus]|uniref:Na+/H+ antiporter n=1 Tax=Sandaracinus amylolyticus TaxID=927083 RepID=UPI001F3DEFBA|nr:Na+/H+ antiporter [Sandaracinus amylolyticus]UJR86693.1 Hypothetical protein I5071_87940 [Sandaracinus amylolyticus]